MTQLTTLELDFLFAEKDSQVSDELTINNDDDGTTELLERIANERDFHDSRGWW